MNHERHILRMLKPSKCLPDGLQGFVEEKKYCTKEKPCFKKFS